MSIDYSKMSDFEINQAVALSIGLDVKHYQDRSGDMVWFTVKNEDGNEYFDYIDYKDFCNNPADAWPIIVGNKISIVSLDNKWIAAPIETVIDGITGDSEVCFYASSDAVFDANPLRAAMIAFLMMQESKNAS